MQDYLTILQKSALFSGVNRQDLAKMLGCLLANIKTYEKNAYIVKASHTLWEVGIVLSGRVNIVKEDYWGNRSILASLAAGELFGEAFACAQVHYNIFSVVAAEKNGNHVHQLRKNCFTVSVCLQIPYEDNP